MQLAWMLATHSDPRFRDGQQAVRWAEAICESTDFQAPLALDALAAAYAEVGQFDKAISTAQRALRVARSGKQPQTTRAIEGRLRSYQAGQAHRE